MSKLIVKIKNSKMLNKGVMKKIKDKIYYKYLNPREEKRTDKYRKEILETFGKICEGKRWFLSSGALLRHYRDNTMDGQDLDIDVFEEDFEEIKDKFIENGFRIKQLFINPDGIITEYRYMYKNAEVDVFLVRKEGEKYRHIYTLEKKNSKDIKREIKDDRVIISGNDYVSYTRLMSDVDKLVEYGYDGITYYGPKYIENHLVELYGYGWKKYDPNYDPHKDPSNNKPIPNPGATSIVYINPVDYYEKFN